MHDRIRLNRKKANTSIVSNPLLVSSAQITNIDSHTHTTSSGHDLSRITPRYQAKLSISQPGDAYEREADTISQKVMGMGDRSIQQQATPQEDERVQLKPVGDLITPLVQREEIPEEEEELQAKSDGNLSIQREAIPEEEEEEPLQMKADPNLAIQREALPEEEEEEPLQMKADGNLAIQREANPEEEEEEPLQMKADANGSIQREEVPDEEEELVQAKSSLQRAGGLAASNDISSKLHSRQGGGSPLSDDVRSFMEPRFGVDFSNVKVHTDGEAVQMAMDVGAQAFAYGSDVYFGAGKLPGNNELTAHELTHVVQQTGDLQSKYPDTHIQTKPLAADITSFAQQDATSNILTQLQSSEIDNPANSPQLNNLDRSTTQTTSSHDFSRIAPFYQDKSSTSQSGEAYEQVADKVGQRASEMCDSSLQQETTLQSQSIDISNQPQDNHILSIDRRIASSLVQRQERDPDEVAATAKEDASIEAKAKNVLKSKTIGIEVPQLIWRLIQSHRLDTNSQLSGVEYKQAQKGIEVKFSGANARTQGSLVAGDDVLQRIANGQSAQVVTEIAAQIGKVDTTRGTIDYVFIMGTDDPKKGNPFYKEAKKFFKAEYPKAVMVEDVRTLEGINQRINNDGKPVANLYIVSHANQDGTLSFSLDSADKSGSVDYQEIKEANAKGDLTKPQEELVGFWTNVMIRGCNLGRSKQMLNEVKSAFGGKSHVTAPTHEQGYGNGTESMAGPFYEEPGISKLTNGEAFKKIKAKPEYSFITDAQWKAMSKTLKREPRQTTEKSMYPYTVDFESAADATSDAIKLAKEEAIKSARDNSSRPNAYIFKVFKAQKVRQGKGAKLTILVENQRTEWVLYHSKINKQGKGFHPSTGTKPWFGETN